MGTNKKDIDLLKYRGNKSSVYTGRPQGNLARTELKLNKLDSEEVIINFIIPEGTSTITPSFFLGLLYDSIKKLGFEKYKNKYLFDIKETNPEIIKILESDIADAERNAINTIKGKRGIDRIVS